MKDLTIILDNRPGALAEMGDALGRAGVSIEGGGAWLFNCEGVAHLLFEDGAGARRAMESASIRVLKERDVLIQRLNQAEPGQLGKISRKIAEAGVNIEVLYSDHDHRLILVVDDIAKGRAVSEAWTHEQGSGPKSHEKCFAAGTQPLKQHTHLVRVDWTGNNGEGTKTYKGYRRDHIITCEGKPQIQGSSDPSFRGDPSRYNPEELLVAGLSSCHMLWYLHLCSVNHVTVVEYCDAASGVLEENANGSGEFVRVLLRPTVKISDGDDQGKALALHDEAHRLCFIANSVRFPVDIVPEIKKDAGAPGE